LQLFWDRQDRIETSKAQSQNPGRVDSESGAAATVAALRLVASDFYVRLR